MYGKENKIQQIYNFDKNVGGKIHKIQNFLISLA